MISPNVPGRAGAPTVPPRPGRPGAAPLALVERRAGGFGLIAPDGRVAGPPDGAFNFVRVHEGRPGPGKMFVSARLPHADLAQGRPVIYAGTAGFRQGALDWWSNYSGTYQPVAAFRDRARLPEDRFVPWQRLQLGGLAQQRGVFNARIAPQAPVSPKPVGKGAPGKGPAAAALTTPDVPTRSDGAPTGPAAAAPAVGKAAAHAARAVAQPAAGMPVRAARTAAPPTPVVSPPDRRHAP